ncbi:hypothetical protein HCU66_17275 [Pseudomonas frederiksbergensis]|uniref:hypothetical protein n=1 Tax=Pseudomonas frederiksbergensis TaxID=104087 RepID=UPI0019816211|nr:hypothetical protein [Pseudomonas frederiksbergensis]MBN3863992.1 hypothetical protein [Pseudomonas frederiksbergensis]
MAIVHPAFCGVADNGTEPGATPEFGFLNPAAERFGCGYKTLQKLRVQLKNR